MSPSTVRTVVRADALHTIDRMGALPRPFTTAEHGGFCEEDDEVVIRVCGSDFASVNAEEEEERREKGSNNDDDDGFTYEQQVVSVSAGTDALTKAAGHRGRVSEARRPGFRTALLCRAPHKKWRHVVDSGNFCMLGADVLITTKHVHVRDCLFTDGVLGNIDRTYWALGTALSEPITTTAATTDDDYDTSDDSEPGLEIEGGSSGSNSEAVATSHTIVARTTLELSLIHI